MDKDLERNFASLKIPIASLRAHYDLEDRRFVLPAHLENREELQKDLEAALRAGRRGDGNWLSGQNLVAELNDEESPYFGRSAFQIFSRAAAFESILAKNHGRFSSILCSNHEVSNLATPVKEIRDYQFRKSDKGLLELFPETVKARETYVGRIKSGIELARIDNDLDLLTGGEVLQQTNLQCTDTEALDLFWQTALMNAWIQGLSTLPVGRREVDGIVAIPSETGERDHTFQGPVAGGPYGLNLPQTGPFANPLSPWPPEGRPYGGFPPYPSLPQPLQSSNWFGWGDETWEITTTAGRDLVISAAGLYLHRAPVSITQATFVKEWVDKGGPKEHFKVKLTALDDLPEPPEKPGGEAKPWKIDTKRDLEEGFYKAKRGNKKWLAKMTEEAEILARRSNSPETILRSRANKAFIGGKLKPYKSLIGKGSWLFAGVDFLLALFRKDGQGLEGPLTDGRFHSPLPSEGGWQLEGEPWKFTRSFMSRAKGDSAGILSDIIGLRGFRPILKLGEKTWSH